MQELSLNEIEDVSGGWNIYEYGAGLASVALSIAIVSNPVGLVGLAGASTLAYFGGTFIGDSFDYT